MSYESFARLLRSKKMFRIGPLLFHVLDHDLRMLFCTCSIFFRYEHHVYYIHQHQPKPQILLVGYSLIRSFSLTAHFNRLNPNLSCQDSRSICDCAAGWQCSISFPLSSPAVQYHVRFPNQHKLINSWKRYLEGYTPESKTLVASLWAPVFLI